MCIILHSSSHFFLPFFPRSQRDDESKANRLIQNIKVTPTPLNTKNTSKTQILRSQPYHVPSKFDQTLETLLSPRPQSIKSKIAKIQNFTLSRRAGILVTLPPSPAESILAHLRRRAKFYALVTLSNKKKGNLYNLIITYT